MARYSTYGDVEVRYCRNGVDDSLLGFEYSILDIAQLLPNGVFLPTQGCDSRSSIEQDRSFPPWLNLVDDVRRKYDPSSLSVTF